MNILTKTIVFLILLCVCLIVLISNIMYNKLQKYHLRQEEDNFIKQTKHGAEDMDLDMMLQRFRKSYSVQAKILDMTRMVKYINEKQHIHNNRKFGGERLKFENAVLVIKVHDNIKYLAVFLESIRRIKFITKSLLIFVHDFYNYEINSLLRRLPFARIMQIFYPYSVQLYPYIYPGRDARFCRQISQCISSNKRNVTLVENKLFWWWATSQIFDHVGVLNNYDGYIYFLETEQYLTSDFIHMAKMLERLQPLFCPECQILSLRAQLVRPEAYTPNSTFIISAWGGADYSNSAIGFNRATWNEIKVNKPQFCYFNDSSWEFSLRNLASQTQQKKFLMLSPEGSRAFPTTGCGAFRNGTNCTLEANFLDILDFVPKIREQLFPNSFKLEREDVEEMEAVEGRGEWEDARDKEFCMFLASRRSRVLYD